jgi:hypothetical protein
MADKNKPHIDEQQHLRQHEELEYHLYAAKVAADEAKMAKIEAEVKANRAAYMAAALKKAGVAAPGQSSFFNDMNILYIVLAVIAALVVIYLLR